MLHGQSVENLSIKEPLFLKEKRKKALQSFNELGMPSFHYGIGIFVDVNELQLEYFNPLEMVWKEVKV